MVAFVKGRKAASTFAALFITKGVNQEKQVNSRGDNWDYPDLTLSCGLSWISMWSFWSSMFLDQEWMKNGNVRNGAKYEDHGRGGEPSACRWKFLSKVLKQSELWSTDAGWGYLRPVSPTDLMLLQWWCVHLHLKIYVTTKKEKPKLGFKTGGSHISHNANQIVSFFDTTCLGDVQIPHPQFVMQAFC